MASDKIAERNRRIKDRYRDLLKEGLQKDKCLDIIESEFPYITRRTIENVIYRRD